MSDVGKARENAFHLHSSIFLIMTGPNDTLLLQKARGPFLHLVRISGIELYLSKSNSMPSQS